MLLCVYDQIYILCVYDTYEAYVNMTSTVPFNIVKFLMSWVW